ncbi:aminoglycoside phosphotransferase family protein [Arenibacterium sp. LLYu02]|uniref:aminoglycoside phosphotransferase family protein n=1 Tax=Arenibacterium sp. LLYu02 TaxID=3404132 RepID=UPI003B227948
MAAVTPLEAMMRDWGLEEPRVLAQTPAADLWRVRRGSRELVLKHYRKGHMGNEATGAAYLSRLPPGLGPKICEVTPDALLMEYLDGHPLAEAVRRASDNVQQDALVSADRRLAQVAADLAAAGVSTEGLLSVSEVFAPLLQSESGRWAQELQALLEATPWGALHGDLHHDNVIETAAGEARVFDAKGLWGPTGYELANAFRHPRGCATLIAQPQVVRRRAREWAEALGTTPDLLLRWALIKVELSRVWSDPARRDADAPLRATLRQVLAED